MDQIHSKVLNLQNRCRDWVDDPSASVSRSLQQEVQRLEDETQSSKNPKSLEGRVRSVIRLLQQAAQSGAMSHSHADELVDQFEDLIQELRKI